jgi:hypothetical protein
LTTHEPRNRRRLAYLSMPVLAGWLFADLFIVLFIVSLASFTPPPAPKPHPSVTPHPTPKPSSSPAKSRPAGLNKQPYTICIDEPETTDDGSLVSDLDQQIPGTARAGFVYVLAPATSLNDIGNATGYANSLISYLQARDPVFANAAGEGGGHTNTAWEIQIFFLNSAQAPTGPGNTICSAG